MQAVKDVGELKYERGSTIRKLGKRCEDMEPVEYEQTECKQSFSLPSMSGRSVSTPSIDYKAMLASCTSIWQNLFLLFSTDGRSLGLYCHQLGCLFAERVVEARKGQSQDAGEVFRLYA